MECGRLPLWTVSSLPPQLHVPALMPSDPPCPAPHSLLSVVHAKTRVTVDEHQHQRRAGRLRPPAGAELQRAARPGAGAAVGRPAQPPQQVTDPQPQQVTSRLWSDGPSINACCLPAATPAVIPQLWVPAL